MENVTEGKPQEESVLIIRDTSRNILKQIRQTQRDEQTDVSRNLENVRFTKSEIEKIAKRLRSKSITLTELQTLKNVIIDDIDNVDVILGKSGALKGIVRELSGNDVNRQIAAAGICCNLSLGGNRSATAVARSAGLYLAASLPSLSTDLVVNCAWALGNLASSGPATCHTLARFGALGELAACLPRFNEDVMEAAAYALMHFAYQMKDELGKKHVEKIQEAYPRFKNVPFASRLMFVISCHDHFPLNVSHTLWETVLEMVALKMQEHMEKCQVGDKKSCDIIYLIRTLANSNINELCGLIQHHIEFNIGIEKLKTLLEHNNMLYAEPVGWLLGNLYNCSGQNDFFIKLCYGDNPSLYIDI